MIKSITSAQNQWVKDVLALQEKAKNRRAAGMFTVEGINEIRLAIKSGLVVKQLAINPDKMSWQELKRLLNVGIELDPTWMIEVLNSAWSKVVVRESGQNALAIFELPKEPNEWKPKSGGLYLLVESVEKPGNLGALLRSADATAADGVVICDERIDAYHPQVIRNSVGTVFTVPLFVMSVQRAWEIIQSNEINLFTTFMENSSSVWDSDLSKTTAILVGTESQGVSDFWRDKGLNINVPMFGKVDSLNVSVAASLLLYEAKRQRAKK
ncbi:MAG: RNA methyltransferase [Bacteroidetes bacterium]|jgi:TrmH family RNA methyltransferase|nr:RNA methyltransferase [Bacteroidota bacterium]